MDDDEDIVMGEDDVQQQPGDGQDGLPDDEEGAAAPPEQPEILFVVMGDGMMIPPAQMPNLRIHNGIVQFEGDDDGLLDPNGLPLNADGIDPALLVAPDDDLIPDLVDAEQELEDEFPAMFLHPNSDEYLEQLTEIQTQRARQTANLRREYVTANSDRVRLNEPINMRIRAARLNYILGNSAEVKRLTSYPRAMLVDLLSLRLDERYTVAGLIEERLRVIGETNYPPPWAALETLFHLAAGTTYKQTANCFGNGQYRLARTVRVVQGILAHRVNPPRVS